jgi:fumarate hydratase class II
MAHNLLESCRLLAAAARVFTERCVTGIEANTARVEQLIEQSLAMCTSLVPEIGYDKAAAIAKQAFATGKTVRQICLEQSVLPAKKLDDLLDPASMTRPH